jgi:hypothetical protein
VRRIIVHYSPGYYIYKQAHKKVIPILLMISTSDLNTILIRLENKNNENLTFGILIYLSNIEIRSIDVHHCDVNILSNSLSNDWWTLYRLLLLHSHLMYSHH